MLIEETHSEIREMALGSPKKNDTRSICIATPFQDETIGGSAL